jgi:exosortase C (VPDSG-CTERM-specific)
MDPSPETPASAVAAAAGAFSSQSREQVRRFFIAFAVLTLGFGVTLYDWVQFALGSQLFSHLPLIPAISAYLIWQGRDSLPRNYTADPAVALVPLLLGAVALGGYGLAAATGLNLAAEDRLALTLLAYVLAAVGLAGWFLGRELLRAVVFPVGFLAFMVPLPVFAVDGIEMFLQHGSAEVSYVLFTLLGTPVFRQDLVFQLPGITLQVAPECSGIHSTLALLITSVLAGYFFLRSPVRRAVLCLAVIPLALVRNGVRIVTIGELCVHISPDMIHSFIHQQGGPIFFAASLVPFFFFLVWLRRGEKPAPSRR